MLITLIKKIIYFYFCRVEKKEKGNIRHGFNCGRFGTLPIVVCVLLLLRLRYYNAYTAIPYSKEIFIQAASRIFCFVLIVFTFFPCIFQNTKFLLRYFSRESEGKPHFSGFPFSLFIRPRLLQHPTINTNTH